VSERPSLLVWQEKLDDTPGYRAVSLMAYVRRIGYVFQANVAQYKTLVAKVQDPALSLPIFDVSNPQAHDELLSEVERLLHNVLMALSTRIDQQRAFMNRHFGDNAELMAEYQAKVKLDFGGYAPCEFVRNLRNYLTHYRLPVTQSRQTFSTHAFSVTFVLLRQPLLDWSGWSAGARTWLQGADDQIEIADLVDGYTRVAGSFDKWLHDRIRATYSAEIVEYENEARLFDEEVERVFGTRP
jgi:hypothetical protein